MSIENPRELYENKKNEASGHLKASYDLERSMGSHREYGVMNKEEHAVYMEKDKPNIDNYWKAMEELRDILGDSQIEAGELNDERNRLIKNVQSALEELHKFEIEKLEMHGGKSESQN